MVDLGKLPVASNGVGRRVLIAAVILAAPLVLLGLAFASNSIPLVRMVGPLTGVALDPVIVAGGLAAGALRLRPGVAAILMFVTVLVATGVNASLGSALGQHLFFGNVGFVTWASITWAALGVLGAEVWAALPRDRQPRPYGG
jgi:hypothetical protein